MQFHDSCSMSPSEEQYRRAELSFDASIPLMKWLGDCFGTIGGGNHPHCEHLRRQQRRLPKRLLDIGYFGKWPCVPKLVHTSGLPASDIDFVALSHVWGSLNETQKEKMSTTSSSLLDREKGISLASMPLQYSAVVILCRCLYFKYLWVDSLCIIQVGKHWHH